MTITPMRLAVVGANGRMGRTLIRVIKETPNVVLKAAIVRQGFPFVSEGFDVGLVAGLGREIGVNVSEDPWSALIDVDGIIDFTSPSATVEYAQFASKLNLVHIIGTTGLSVQEEKAIDGYADRARIVKSANMSVGVNLLSVLAKIAARALSPRDWDVEILEMHHRHKLDAPSGTALLLGKAVAEGRDISLSENSVRDRNAYTGPRERGSIGFATLRGGSVVGEHSLVIAGEGETITLSHRTTDRSIFAHGAINAALWAFSQKPGLYSMLDVLGLE